MVGRVDGCVGWRTKLEDEDEDKDEDEAGRDDIARGGGGEGQAEQWRREGITQRISQAPTYSIN